MAGAYCFVKNKRSDQMPLCRYRVQVSGFNTWGHFNAWHGLSELQKAPIKPQVAAHTQYLSKITAICCSLHMVRAYRGWDQRSHATGSADCIDSLLCHHYFVTVMCSGNSVLMAKYRCSIEGFCNNWVSPLYTQVMMGRLCTLILNADNLGTPSHIDPCWH